MIRPAFVALLLAALGCVAEAQVVQFTPTQTYTAGASIPERAARHDYHDEGLLMASIQGVVNRAEPRLLLDALGPDATWLPELQRPGQPLAGRALTRVRDPLAVYGRFASQLRGAILWDPGVPATLNVATTVAGVEDLVLLRHDARPSSLYQRLMARPDAPAVVIDLRGKFTGRGRIWQTSRPSSASAKNDAYRWLIERYVRTGRVGHTRMGYLIDATWLARPLGPLTTQLYNRDLMIAERAVCFDLSTWGDETPSDDPSQPLGTDRATLLELLRAVYELHGGEGFTQVSGFTPWAWKYTTRGGGRHGPVESEWDLARVLSAYNMGIDGDALGATTIANASVWQHLELPRRAPSATPSAAALRDRGAWDNRLQNPGFEEGAAPLGWSVDLPGGGYVVRSGARAARHGLQRFTLRSGARGSVHQDVAVSLRAGQSARISAWVRRGAGAGDLTLALWGMGNGGAAHGVSRTRVERLGEWTRLEARFTARRDRRALRWQLYLPAGVHLDLDACALWIEGREAGVRPLHYVTWHMGDYDGAAWLYNWFRDAWDDPQRGALPLAWGLNPNLIDRFPPAFTHAWRSATPRDQFSAADSVASYVNVSQLSGLRAPSRLPDGRAAFERFARPYLQRAGVQSTLFALNGAAGDFGPEGLELLARLCGRGVGWHPAGQGSPIPSHLRRTPFVQVKATLSNAGGESERLAESLRRVQAATQGAGPGFHVFRSVLWTPSQILRLTERLQAADPGRVCVLGPRELFALRSLAAGRRPAYRVAFLQDDLPARAAPGARLPLEVRLRNDGWETWIPGQHRLGLHLSSGEIAPRSLPSDARGYPTRFALPRPVAPGEEVVLRGQLPLPTRAGCYHVQLDLVREGVSWFESQGSLPWQTTIEVR